MMPSVLEVDNFQGKKTMYAMTAAIEPGAVRFEAPMLELPAIRELTAIEIDSICGGASFLGFELDFTQAAIVGGFTAFGGGIAGLGGGPIGVFTGVVGGFVGGFTATIAVQVISQI